MTPWLIDAEVAGSLVQHSTGGKSWAGLLVGHPSAGDSAHVLGYALLPRAAQAGNQSLFLLDDLELFRDLLHRRASGRFDLDLIGGLVLGEPLHETALRTFWHMFRRIVPQGLFVYRVSDGWSRSGSVLVGVELAQGEKVDLRQVAQLRQPAEQEILETVVDHFWQELAADRQQRPGRSAATLRCLVDVRLEHALRAFALRQPRSEIGGVLLGTRQAGTTQVAAAIFPPQSARAWDRCEFETTALGRVCEALETLSPSAPAATGNGLQPVGWIHTHPHLGVFLSATDLVTFRQWAALDPAAIALVLDPFARGAEWLACNGACERIVLELRALRPPLLPGPRETEQLVRQTGVGWSVVVAEGVCSA